MPGKPILMARAPNGSVDVTQQRVTVLPPYSYPLNVHQRNTFTVYPFAMPATVIPKWTTKTVFSCFKCWQPSVFFIRKVKKFYGFVANIQVSSTRQMICLDRGPFPHYRYNLVFLWPSALNMKYIQHRGTWLKPGILWISIVDTHASTRCHIYCFRFARCCDSCLYEPEIIDTRLMADSS